MRNLKAYKQNVDCVSVLSSDHVLKMFPKNNLYWHCCCDKLAKDIDECNYVFFRDSTRTGNYRLMDKERKSIKFCPYCGERILFSDRVLAKYSYYTKWKYAGSECEMAGDLCISNRGFVGIEPLPDDWRAGLDPSRNP